MDDKRSSEHRTTLPRINQGKADLFESVANQTVESQFRGKQVYTAKGGRVFFVPLNLDKNGVDPSNQP